MIRTTFAAALLLVAVAALAQSPLTIERVEVIAERTRPDIVIAEMRLPKGRPLTIEEIEQAVYRVRRLPFVAYATYVLEPGVAPDARVLRVTLVDETPLHLDLEAQGVAQRGGYATSTSTIGLRFFPTRSGALDMNLGGSEFSSGGATGVTHLGDISVQYTGYGLFGTSAYAGVGVSTHYNGRDRLVSPVLLVGIPLTQSQTVRGTYSRTGYKSDNHSLATVEWLMEKTDDPYFGRRGFSIAAGPQWEKSHFVADFNPPPHVFHVDDRLEGRGFGINAEKYWPAGQHGAYWARASDTHLVETQTSNGVKGHPTHRDLGDVLGGVAWNFDGGRDAGDQFHRGRIEFGAGYHRDHQNERGFIFDRSGGELFLNLAYRNRVGIFRIGVNWVSSNKGH